MTSFSYTARFYKDALDSARQGVWDYNTATGRKYHSDVWREIRGLTPDMQEKVDDDDWFESVHPDDRDLAREQTRRLNAGEIVEVNYEYRERHVDGHWIWIMCRGRAIAWDTEGRPVRFVGTDTDITPIKLSEERLRQTRRKLELALSSIEAGVWEYRGADESVQWDARQRSIYGVPLDASPMPRDVWERSIHPEDLPRIEAIVAEALAAHTDYSLHYRIIRPDGEIRYINSHVSFLDGTAEGPVMVGLDLDITEDHARAEALRLANQLAEQRNRDLEAARARMEYGALHDALTGLANRRYLEQMQQAAEDSRVKGPNGPAILLLDLDRFKQINDVFGHGAGDHVLRHTADLLRNCEVPGAFPARVGGDEFAVFLPDPPDDAELVRLATRLIDQVSQPTTYEGYECRVGLSIGIARAEGEGFDGNRLLRDADLALYRAKSEGRRRVAICTPALRDEAELSKRRSDELLVAIERQDFVCAYQPQFDTVTGALSGIEALARWQRPDGTLLLPADFLPIAEAMELMASIDRIILQKAVADLQDWTRAGLTVPRLSINLSKARLAEASLIPDLRALDVDHTRLCFELLESNFLEDHDQCIAANLAALRALGIGIEVDDFGTGHASILSLLRLKPDRLKIDRAFVEPVERSAQQAQLLRSIVEIGHLLGMAIVGEGVETEGQRRILTEIRCDHLQGFLLARPMVSADLARFLTAQDLALRPAG
jgi:diguanylate cyclase (GGDEF)-like protein/PAS domain S-box-containing protein